MKPFNASLIVSALLYTSLPAQDNLQSRTRTLMGTFVTLTLHEKYKALGYILVEPAGNILFGNLEKFLDITWKKH